MVSDMRAGSITSTAQTATRTPATKIAIMLTQE
jgi:hypothetical protein